MLPKEALKLKNIRYMFFLALIVFVLLVIYFQALQGPFIFDDYGNVVSNGSLLINELSWETLKEAMFSRESGPLGRPISMASFALNYYFLGPSGLGFKAVNLVIHIINTCLVYCLVLSVIRCFFSSAESKSLSCFFSLFATAMWAFHPINLTSVVFVVQRMTSLSAMFLLIGINVYIYQRLKFYNLKDMPFQSQLLGVFSLFFFTMASSLSKETGLLLPGFVLLIEAFLFKLKGLNWQSSPLLWIFSVLLIAGAIAVLGMFFDWHRYSFDRFDEIYNSRPFTLSERILTEARVMWFYVGQIWIPDITKMGLHHDDFLVSRNIIDPLSTLFSIVAWFILGIILVALIFTNKARIFSFSILWFFWGHIMESTVVPLELVYEHRNYIPMLGFVFMWAWILRVSMLRFSKLKVGVVGLFVCLLLASATFSRASNWIGWGELALSEVARNPKSSRNHHEAGRWYFAQLMQEEHVSSSSNYIHAREHFEAALRVDQTNSAGLYALFRLNGIIGKPIEPEWIDELEYRMKTQVITTEHGVNLLDWLGCVISGSCAVEDTYIQRIANAFVSNGSSSPESRAMTLSYFGVYELAQGHLNVGVDYFRMAKENWSQEPLNWENLIRALIELGDSKGAQLLLDEYEQKFGERIDEFNEMTGQLAALRLNSG
ncbi:MAG: hypothetical protein H6999_04950 [Hahellaceae bacterium]|nr:hypothetical protein [Hahellaceae bacterium]